MWPEIQEIFVAFTVPKPDQDTLINDMLTALLYKWDSITNHEYWLRKTLENRCRRHYGESDGSGSPEGDKKKG